MKEAVGKGGGGGEGDGREGCVKVVCGRLKKGNSEGNVGNMENVW